MRVGVATVALVATLAGCGGLGDAFSLRPRVAARAAGHELSVERLAHWIADIKRASPQAEHLEAVAGVYVDDMLFGAAAAEGRNFDDSLVVLAVRWPMVAQLRWRRFHDQLVLARGPLTAAQVDSAYRAGRVRLMQHLLLRVGADAPPDTVEKIRARADALRRQLVAGPGAAFAALARRSSEDPGSRAGGGYLSVGGREEFVSPFDTVAWALAPGEISAVVRSPFGFHVIRRPPLAEVRESYTTGLGRLVSAHQDSARLEGLARTRHVEIEPDAPRRVRELFNDLIAARSDSRPLVRFDGGVVRVKDAVRWIFALNPDQVALLPTAGDAQLRRFLEAVAERELVLSEADSAGVTLTPAEWQSVRAEHDSSIRSVEDALGVSPAALSDSTPDRRRALAVAHVLGYLDRMFSGAVPMAAVPPFLAAALRDSATWSISRRGVAAATERAGEFLAAGAGRRERPLPAHDSLSNGAH